MKVVVSNENVKMCTYMLSQCVFWLQQAAVYSNTGCTYPSQHNLLSTKQQTGTVSHTVSDNLATKET